MTCALWACVGFLTGVALTHYMWFRYHLKFVMHIADELRKIDDVV